MTGREESPIYRDLMRFKPNALSANAWAVKAGVSRTVWTDMRRHDNPSRRTLEKLLNAVGSSLAEFEALRLGAEARQPIGASAANELADVRPGWTPAQLPSLPLVVSSLAGEWSDGDKKIEVVEIGRHELLERLPRPASLARDAEAFAFTIVGGSMAPRFRPGMRVAVSPRSPVAVCDDVIVRLRPSTRLEKHPERVLIMQFVRRTAAGFELRQFNPDLTIHVGDEQAEAILKIAGELI